MVDSGKHWKKIGLRSYHKRTPKYDAFVFGADRPECLWAWTVYWIGGQVAGVDGGFRAAKKNADSTIGAVGDGR